MARHPRRALLRGLTASLLGAPLFGGLAHGQAAGQPPKNLVLVTWPEGLEVGWQPTGFETSFDLGETLAPFAPNQHDLLVLDGLKSGYNVFESLLAHNLGTISLWTGARSRGVGGLQELSALPSIDQLVAQRIGGEAAFSSLHFGVQTNRYSFISTPYLHFSGPEQPMPAEDDPNVMFGQIFGGALGTDPASIELLRRRRASVLDFVRRDIKRIEPRIAASDRPKLQAHLAGVESIEKSLSKLGEGCATPDGIVLPTREAADRDENFQQVISLQSDLLVHALSCGVTRVATLQLSNTDSQTKISGIATTRSVHEAQHSGTVEDRKAVAGFFIEQLAALVGKLAATEVAPGRRLLDDTLVVMGSEMGVGTHTPDPAPFFIAGGGGGYFELGRYLKLPQPLQHTRLLISVLHAMGLTDITTLGDFPEAEAQGPIAL